MTPDDRRFAITSGLGGGVILLGFLMFAVRGADGSPTSASADQLHASYRKLYHPDKPDGLEVEKARIELRSKVVAQKEELIAAESALSPALPEAYTKNDLADAGNQIRSDYAAIRQLAARTRILIPSSLPFEGGLDADAKARARQLAQLRLVQVTLETCLHAGVSKISGITPGDAMASPMRSDALFTCVVDIEATWDAGVRLLAGIATPDGRGIGLRALDISTVGADKTQRIRMTTHMTTPYRDAWDLAPMAQAAPREAPAGSAPAKAPSVRRLGGAKP